VARARRAIDAHGDAVRRSAHDTYTVSQTTVDPSGASHVRYQRSFRDLPVLGGDFVVHNAPGGELAGVSSGLGAPLDLDVTPTVLAAAAVAAAAAHFTAKHGRDGRPRPARLVVDATSGKGRLAWEVVVDGQARDGVPSRLRVYVDARSGGVLRAIDGIRRGSGESVYGGTVPLDTTATATGHEMVDPVRGNATTCDANQRQDPPTTPPTPVACATFTSPNDRWGDGTQGNRQSAGVDAHYGAAMTFDYFKNVHGRDGIFNNGRGVTSRVHYGNGLQNSFWDTDLEMMAYGDGLNNAHP
jgi:Zn-dependent metalloprotease